MTDDDYLCDDCGTFFPSAQAFAGHRQVHGKKAAPAPPRPSCFTDDREWLYSLQQLRTEDPTAYRNARRQRRIGEFALAEACAACPIEYMEEMQSKGRCHPPASAVPQRDLNLDELEMMQ